MVKVFEKIYLEYLDVIKARYNMDDGKISSSVSFDEEMQVYEKVTDACFKLIDGNNWNYEDFLDFEFRNGCEILSKNQSLEDRRKDRYEFILNDEFRKVYDKEADLKLYFLFLLINEREPLDISETMIVVADSMININNWSKVYGCVQVLSLYNNPICLPLIDNVLRNIKDEYLHQEFLFDISGILSSIANKKAFTIVKKHLNNSIGVVQNQMKDVYEYFKSQEWIDSNGNWIKN